MLKNQRKYLLPQFILVGIIMLVACQQPVRTELQQIVDDVRTELAPDGRVAIFDVALTMDGNSLTISGEVDRPQFRDTLLARLRRADTSVNDQIVVLSETLPDSAAFGIVRISVAHMRSRPSALADLVNQPILGDLVRLLKFNGEYYLVQNWDGYIGWLRGGSLALVDSMEAVSWQSGTWAVHTANYGVVRAEPHIAATISVDLVAGVRLKLLASDSGWSRVALPGGNTGFVLSDGLIKLAGLGHADAAGIITTAQKFRGIPYLWGGTSTKGFDCSGFTQTVFRLNNMLLPRDASQQALVGQAVLLDNNFTQLKPGDLLFFGSSSERITHEAIYLGGLDFIHAGGKNGQVAVNSLDPGSDLYSEHRLATLRLARRIIGQ